LGGIDADALTGLVQEVDVFARVSPSHKLEIVQALRRAGQIVAMTGDGINDGPALKAADVGVAMGSAQLDVARSVADIVIEDDNLATLVTAIAEGRTTYGNIRKTVKFLLSTNFGEIGIVLASLLLGLKPPFNAMQLLWINLVTDIFPGLALAQEPAEDGVLARPPRDPAEPIIDNEDLGVMIRESAVMTGGTLASYLYGLWRYGPGPQASTLALSTIVGGELAHALACRSDELSLLEHHRLAPNRKLDLALGGTAAIQWLATALPPLRRLLGTAPLGPLDLLVSGLSVAIPELINDRLTFASRDPGGEDKAAAPDNRKGRPGKGAGRAA
jgi:Ca2+-transporting ATPase